METIPQKEWNIVDNWVTIEGFRKMPSSFKTDWKQLQATPTYSQLERFHTKYRKKWCVLANVQLELIYSKLRVEGTTYNV